MPLDGTRSPYGYPDLVLSNALDQSFFLGTFFCARHVIPQTWTLKRSSPYLWVLKKSSSARMDLDRSLIHFDGTLTSSTEVSFYALRASRATLFCRSLFSLSTRPRNRKSSLCAVYEVRLQTGPPVARRQSFHQ